MFEYALFDLDGTLTDPALGITNSIMYALDKMGREIPPRESLYSFIGPPLSIVFPIFFNITCHSHLVSRRILCLYDERGEANVP